ncbi:MAG: AbrB/MazE/SpoVT family DNA-binding domain-containing protein [Thermoproteales archaeon]|nr:AbrB/MazE/SpoVT family DNA-binding domain-containing protein [Thermoproteales archaeon]
MVRIRIKVGPKGQIVIPKVFRENYRIKEGGYVILEPADDKLIVRGVEDPKEVLEWIRSRRKRIKSREARLGDLINVDLEEEFEE